MTWNNDSLRKFTLPIIGTLIVALGLLACEGDYRKRAQGTFGELIVVMDSSNIDTPLGKAIQNSFGGSFPGVPGFQPKYDIRFVDFNTESKLEQIKRMKNVLIAAPIDEESNVGDLVRAMLPDEVESRVRQGENFAFPLGDRWYKDQWVMVVTSSSNEMLAQKIKDSGGSLVDNLDESEVQRWKYEVYEKGEQIALADSLWDEKGFKFRIQHDYKWHIDTTDFVSFRRFLPSNDRWIWVWWKNGVKSIDHIDKDWINNKRDSLMKIYIRGTRDSSYVTTEYRRDITLNNTTINGNFAFETRGTWRMTGDAMGGPFLNYTIYGEDVNRLFMIEFGQFAPKYKKRRFVRQFEAMARTFQIDSTYNESVVADKSTASK